MTELHCSTDLVLASDSSHAASFKSSKSSDAFIPMPSYTIAKPHVEEKPVRSTVIKSHRKSLKKKKSPDSNKRSSMIAAGDLPKLQHNIFKFNSLASSEQKSDDSEHSVHDEQENSQATGSKQQVSPQITTRKSKRKAAEAFEPVEEEKILTTADEVDNSSSMLLQQCEGTLTEEGQMEFHRFVKDILQCADVSAPVNDENDEKVQHNEECEDVANTNETHDLHENDQMDGDENQEHPQKEEEHKGDGENEDNSPRDDEKNKPDDANVVMEVPKPIEVEELKCTNSTKSEDSDGEKDRKAQQLKNKNRKRKKSELESLLDSFV